MNGLDNAGLALLGVNIVCCVLNLWQAGRYDQDGLNDACERRASLIIASLNAAACVALIVLVLRV